MGNVVQAVLFQLAWFACVLGGAAGTSIWGAGTLAALLAYSTAARGIATDLALAGALAVVGFVIDTAWIHAGVLSYSGASVAPVWIVLLWAAVGLSMNHSLSFFKLRPWLGGMLAGVAAPFSYLAGEAFGAVTVPEPFWLAAVSLVWFVVFALGFGAAASVGSGQVSLEERA